MFRKIVLTSTLLISLVLIHGLAEAKVFLVGGLTREKVVEPGETHQGAILIRNTEEEMRVVRVYQTDYLFFSDGTNQYGQPAGKLERSNAQWITFSPARVEVPPQGTATISYIVKVPQIVTVNEKNEESQKEKKVVQLIGTFWSMLMVEPLAKSSPELVKPEKGKVQIGITQVFRYGIQFVTHIGDTGERKLKFAKIELKAEEAPENPEKSEGHEEKQPKRILLVVDLENVGERWLRPVVWVKLFTGDGVFIGQFESGGKKRIYSGTSVRHQIDLTDVPAGEYEALIVADNGDQYIFGSQVKLNLQPKKASTEKKERSKQ